MLVERRLARGDNIGRMKVGEPLGHAQAEPDSAVFSCLLFNRAVPAAAVDADRAHFDLMVAGVADDLGGRVETHRLGVEQGRAEDVRMVAFHPGRSISDLGEAGGVAFGEAVASETLDLLEGALGEILGIAIGDHAVDHLVAKFADSAGAP